jgi:large subunit ribosomal protein L22
MAARERQEVRAVAKWIRLSPRKARVVLTHIRGRSVPEARTVLAFTPRHAAREIERVLHSAVANAEENHGLVGDELVVSQAYADEGPVLKRWKPRARGRIGRIHKPTCHITVVLSELERTPRQRRPLTAQQQRKLPETTVEPPTSDEKAEARRGAETEEVATT